MGDGSPAHTIKKFGVVNRYDLSEKFPILTLRPTNLKAAIDEILWIWQKKSSNIKDLNSHIWDNWADDEGSIGKAYGYQLGIKQKYAEGYFDQVDRLLFDLKNNPYSRRLIVNMGIIVCRSVERLFDELKRYENANVFVIGGDSVYRQLLPY